MVNLKLNATGIRPDYTLFPVATSIGVAVIAQKGLIDMDVILHVGAHRTGTTTFQHYMRGQHAFLKGQRIGFWGPNHTRKSVFPGLFPHTMNGPVAKTSMRAIGRISLQMKRAEQRGLRHLVVSDENMMGTPRRNLRTCTLYPGVGENMARLRAAFFGKISRVVMSVRSQDHWWASAAAMTVGRGHLVPSRARCEEIAADPRTWRDVITDLACALPDVEICVLPFEQYIGQPQDILRLATGCDAPSEVENRWLNRAPNLKALRQQMAERGDLRDPRDIFPEGQGRWMPFSKEQCAQLREAYTDDMHWLMAGADGLAQLITDPTRTQTGLNLHAGELTEGRTHDIGQKRLAHPG